MKAHWLILEAGRPRETIALYEAVDKSGREVRSVRRVPDAPGEVFPDEACVVSYGPMDQVAELGRRRKWRPIAWDDRETFSCHTYYAHWARDIVQQDYVLLPLAEVRRKHAWLYRSLGTNSALFLRPDANDKAFGGEMVREADFESWSQERARAAVDPATVCVAGRPLPIDAEWRLVIRRGRALTGSSYRLAGAVDTTQKPPRDAVSFAESVALRPFPGLPRIYVMDVAMTEGKLAVMEIGSINSAGLYGCDVEAIVAAASQEAEEEWATSRDSPDGRKPR